MSTIVVGVDGSAAADAALEFALEEARLRKLPLRVICASEVPPIEYAGAVYTAAADLSVEADHHAAMVIEQAIAKLGTDPGVPVETLTIHGHPATVLVEQAEGAALLVVGTRGLGGLKSLLLGSVSQAIAHHCTCPVVIVPGPRRAADPAAH
jgi:nucleotide-binding universal stress UspA family protein